jgi:hypothetical protein
VSFIQNILLLATSWSAKAVQNYSIGFCEVIVTIECNSPFVSINFFFVIIDLFINSFGIIDGTHKH